MQAIVVNAFPLFQQALCTVIHRVAPDMRVLVARDLGSATALVRTHHEIDVAVLDLELPDMRGLGVLRAFRSQCPAVRTIVMADGGDATLIECAWAAGSSGFISKSAPLESVVESMRRIIAGTTAYPAPRGSGVPDRSKLTERQIDVLEHLMCGMPNKAIARALGMATGTVKVHVSALLHVLGARNRTEAVIAARALGFVPAVRSNGTERYRIAA